MSLDGLLVVWIYGVVLPFLFVFPPYWASFLSFLVLYHWNSNVDILIF